MEELPNELRAEILTRTQEPSFDLVENSAQMDKMLLNYSLSRVSKGMKEIASLFLADLPKTKIWASQWAVFFAHRGYVSYLKELEEKKKFKYDVWIHWVAVEANQREAAAYLETKIDVTVQSNWSQDLQIVIEQTGESKWKCFEALRKNRGDIVSAIMDLTM